LFIDEIGELPGSLQPKLLRVLEDGSLRRVGSALERRVNVRIIAATNRNLEREVEQSRFREDLFYRINVLSLQLPNLRERVEDIPLLVRHFLPEGWKIEDDALVAMCAYQWPGNVRQLSNIVERATILANDRVVTIRDLPREVVSPGVVRAAAPVTMAAAPQEEPLDASLASIEKAHVLDVLKSLNGNKARAARALGIHRRKLYRLLERFGLSEPATSANNETLG
jgi:DNA-binding NtrC family response regulator